MVLGVGKMSCLESSFQECPYRERGSTISMYVYVCVCIPISYISHIYYPSPSKLYSGDEALVVSTALSRSMFSGKSGFMETYREELADYLPKDEQLREVRCHIIVSVFELDTFKV